LDEKRARETIERLEGRRVLVVGDVMLDRYLWGTVTRISPEAPVPVVDVKSETYRLGGAANVAQNVLSLGAFPALVGVVGDDEPGRKLAALVREAGVGRAILVGDSERKTTVKTRVVAHNQQVVRADEETRVEISGQCLADVRRAVASEMEGCDAVVVSDYGKGALPRALVEFVIDGARRRGLPVCVDPQEAKMDSYRAATVITPNVAQAGSGYGKHILDEETLMEVGWGLRERLGCEAVLITRGPEGMSLFEASGAETHLPALARKVYDVTGAGDTVIGVLASALASGAPMVDAAFLANHAASIVVGELGTACVNGEQLARSLGG